MKFDLIRSWDELAVLSEQWNDLLSRSRVDTIFLRWEWICAWKDTCAYEVKPFVLIVRDDGNQIVSLIPLYKAEYKLCKLLRYTVLRVMADTASGSEYPAWIISKKHECDEMYVSIINELELHATEWDCVWMRGVRAQCGQQKEIRKSAERKFYLNSRKNNSSSINLENKKEGYLQLLSRNMRSQLRRDFKKALAHGDLCVTKCLDNRELDLYMESLYQLHDVRWKKKGLQGLFERRPEEASFYKSFIPVAFQNGWLRLYALHQGGSNRAVQLGYVYNKIYSQLQEGFNPDYSSGAGNVLRLHVIDDCIRNGISEYDFLTEHTEHKRRWGAKEIVGYDIFFGKKSLKTMILFVGRAWPTGRLLKVVN